MGALEQIVKITVKVEAPSGAQGPFANCLLLSSDCPFSDAYRKYDTTTAVDDMVADGFAANSTSVKKVRTMISSGESRIDFVYVGKRAHSWTQVVELTPTAFTNSTVYKVTVDGQTATYTSDSSATATEICDGIAGAITSLAAGVTAVNSSSTKVVVTSTATNTIHSFRSLVKMTKKDATVDANAVADYAALKLVLTNFYFVSLDSPSDAAQAAMAGQIESETRFMLVPLSDSGVKDPSITNDQLSTLAAFNYERSGGYYHSDENANIDCAAIGERAPVHPRFGASWAFKTLKGVELEDLTPTELGAILDKGGNTYEDIGGDAVTRPGVTFGGSYIDLTTGKDALTFDLRVAGWNGLKADLPYTNQSADIICNALRNVCKVYKGTGNNDGFLDPNFVTEVTHPDVTTVNSTDKAARILKGIVIKDRLASRLGGLEINVYLSV